VNNVVHGRFGNFVRRAFLMCLCGDFASAPSMVEELALTLCAKAPKDIMERAATATKVLMDFMVVFLKLFCSDRAFALM
jgi:hypothetical protein